MFYQELNIEKAGKITFEFAQKTLITTKDRDWDVVRLYNKSLFSFAIKLKTFIKN